LLFSLIVSPDTQDNAKPLLDKTGDEAAGEEKQHDEVNKSETEEAPTAVDGMIHALRATSTALDQAQKSVKTLNSLPINV
jgi:hypothetical protein